MDSSRKDEPQIQDGRLFQYDAVHDARRGFCGRENDFPTGGARSDFDEQNNHFRLRDGQCVGSD